MIKFREFIAELSDAYLRRYADKSANDLRARIYAPDRDAPSQGKKRAKRTGGLVRASARLRGDR